MKGLPVPPYILALDIGTSGVRALLFDQHGDAVERSYSRATYHFEALPNGGSEIDAEKVLENVLHCLDQVLEKCSELIDDIAGVAACSLVSNVLGVNAHGQAITPVYSYADTRPALDCEALRQMADEEAIHQRTGCYFHTSYLPARFLWLKRVLPESFQQCWRWVSLGEYLWLKLFGETRVSYSVASWTGLLDRHHLVWDEELLSLIKLSADKLSPLCDLDQPIQGLKPEYAKRWPALRRVPWYPTIGDGAAANIGSGCCTMAQTAISLGSTSAVRSIVNQINQVPKGLWCYRVDRRRSLLGGALTEGGNFIIWLRNLLKLDSTDIPEETLLETVPGRHGLTFLPLVAGERSPGWNPSARGIISGLTLATTPLDLLQAGLEGIICRIAQVYEILASALPSQPQIIASGGAATHDRFLIAGLADALGQPIYLSQASEASARGAALLALEALGLIEAVEGMSYPVNAPIYPDPEKHIIYLNLIQKQRQLYQRNFP